MCMTPLTIKNKKITPDKPELSYNVPCGKCPKCRTKRMNGWAFRLEQQAKISSSARFITLTYSSDNIPILENGKTTLKKVDIQLFMKRLRKLNKEKISYYAVGEYGGETHRPHYHIIMFNCEIETIQKAWQLGEVHYGQSNLSSIKYTLKYLYKLSRIDGSDGRQPEFQLMSKGLGANYITDQTIDWHNNTNNPEKRFYLPQIGNTKIPMPRYYKNKIYGENNPNMERIQQHYQSQADNKQLTFKQMVKQDDYLKQQERLFKQNSKTNTKL